MKHEDKKHFDISKPRWHIPDPTSKPIIVGHHPTMPDPMIREEGEKAPRPIKVTADGDEPESLTVKQPEKSPEELIKPDNLPGLADISAPHETSPALTPSAEPPPSPQPSHTFPTEPTPAESAPSSVSLPTSTVAETTAPPSNITDTTPSPVLNPLPSVGKAPEPPVPAEPPTGQELHIPAGHGHATVHHKPRLWVWVVAVIIILIWAYAAIDALTAVKLPVEFFKSPN